MRLLVVGAGGHAKVVIDAARLAGFEIAGVIGTPPDLGAVLGHPVVHGREGIQADGFIVAIGDNTVRSRIFGEYAAAGLTPISVVHPSAIIGTEVTMGEGTFVAAGVIVNTGARIGADSILNTGCAVDHDCAVGAHSHLGPRVALCGAVTIGDGALLGVGSCAAPGASVGPWSVIGAGAAIVGALPARMVCVGVPARPVRDVDVPPRA